MDTIEVHEGHEVTQAAFSVNIGSGLLEAMRVDPHAYRGGDIVDIVCRVQIGQVAYKPVTKGDYEGPWKRVHTATPLAAVPTSNVNVGKILDTHIAKVSKRRELPGQGSIDDEIAAAGDADQGKVRGIHTGKKAAKKPAKKATKPRTPAMPKNTPAGLPPEAK